MNEKSQACQTLEGIIADRSGELEAIILSYRDGGDPVAIVEKIIATKRQIAELKELHSELKPKKKGSTKTYSLSGL